jgi:hypothetical protein
VSTEDQHYAQQAAQAMPTSGSADLSQAFAQVHRIQVSAFEVVSFGNFA